MKKRTIIALIVAVLLVVAGCVVLMLGLSFAGDSAAQSVLTEQEVLISESFESVVIDTEDCNVTFVPFKGDADARVVIREREAISHSVLVEEGTLRIRMMDNRQWTDHIGVNWESMEMTVYLPEAEYASLQVRTDTGNIAVSEEPSFKEMILRSDTGDIYCDDTTTENLDCMTITGDITVRGGTPTKVKLHSGTGNLKTSGVNGTEIHLKTDTGEVDTEHVTTKMFTCSSNTGEVKLEGVLAEEYLQIRTDTGDVGVENCDAGRVDIETDTGDVSGHFLTPKWFSAFSDTGNVTVPNTPDGGECRIQTDSGDIHFE